MSEEGEKVLKSKFQHLAKNDFLVYPDVYGKELVHGKKVIIDFMLYPKSHLLDAGFDSIWFGVEVKHFGIAGETGKMSRFIWQCITYTQSNFEVDKIVVKPTFVLGFSDVYEANSDNNDFSKEYLSQFTGMLRLAGLAHVGTFQEIMPTKNKPGGWNIVFSSSSYFRHTGNGYEKTKYNIFKVNIGNSAS